MKGNSLQPIEMDAMDGAGHEVFARAVEDPQFQGFGSIDDWNPSAKWDPFIDPTFTTQDFELGFPMDFPQVRVSDDPVLAMSNL
jgi:hypothetical protein